MYDRTCMIVSHVANIIWGNANDLIASSKSGNDVFALRGRFERGSYILHP